MLRSQYKRSRPSLFFNKGDARILRRTFLIAILIVSSVLIIGGIIELIFRHRENVESIHALQQEMAHNAAFKIQQFVETITQTLHNATQTSEVVNVGLTRAYRFQLLKLLRVSPAITTIAALDSTGREKLKMSRVSTMEWDELVDRSREKAFIQTKAGASFFGKVYFVRQSEPHMRVAVPIQRLAGEVIGVLIAEVNLTYIWNVISNITVGETGYAYVVSPEGDLIAHSDMSLALRQQNLKHLSQVGDALSGIKSRTKQQNLQGEKVYTIYTLIPALDWMVFVERLTQEAYAPLYASLMRLSLLLLVGFVMAVRASLMIVKRVLQPVEVLRLGAKTLGAGALHHRINIHTGDEFQVLAETFNHMAEQLQASHSHLEQEVEIRTQELAHSVVQLKIVSQHKSRILANMTHELRNPMIAILGYTVLILDNFYGDVSKSIRNVLEQLQHSANHLLKVINDVLDISYIESGQMILSIADYSMLDIVQTVTFSVKGLVSEKQLELTVTTAPDLPIGLGDETRLTQLLLNIVNNAITYTEAGRINIDVAASDRSFRISVRDTGPGIAPADQQRIFESFERVDMSDTRLHRGTGLGLAICKNIVEFHGGRIGVTSALGQGSTFWCTFPIRVES